ncbi:hypothetical protein [Kineococcus esterisolvens]|uniref:hypothetical protein n=1 Tax=unclassified Kineococcus TaxID=2621656 RepID=UPI003D7D80BB
MLSKRWAREPRWVQAAATALVLLLAWGGLQHLLDFLTGGWSPYAYAPRWLATYWSALLLLDPLVAVLIARRRRAGLLLGPLIPLTDAAANGYAIHALGLGGPLAPIGQGVVSVVAIASTVLTPRLLRLTNGPA